MATIIYMKYISFDRSSYIAKTFLDDLSLQVSAKWYAGLSFRGDEVVKFEIVLCEPCIKIDDMFP